MVRFLASLAKNREANTPAGATARQTLAELRHGANFSPRGRLRMVKHVVRFLGDRPDPADEWFYVVAALFAVHRSPLARPSQRHLVGSGLGAAFREIKDTSGSVEGRLLTLVNSGPSTLAAHLRQAVSLLSSNEVPLDWEVLLIHLLQWRHPRRKVQEQWLREFYGAPLRRAGVTGEEAAAPDEIGSSLEEDTNEGDDR